MDECYLPEQIERRLNLPAGRVKRMAKAGNIPAFILPGGAVRIPKAEFEAWLKSRSNAPCVTLLPEHARLAMQVPTSTAATIQRPPASNL